MKRLHAATLLYVYLVTMVSCAGHVRVRGNADFFKGDKSVILDRHANLKGQNSYYYFIVSQLKSLNELKAEAYGFLKQALKKDRDSSFLITQKAYFEADGGLLEPSARDATKALKTDPGNVSAMLLLGKIHSSKREYGESLNLFKRALRTDPKNEEAYNLLARDYLVTENMSQAIVILRQCQSEIPESIACPYYLGTIHLEKKDYDRALHYFTQITDYNPGQTKILETIGEIHIKKNDFQKALEIFHQLSQQEPDVLASQMRVGLLYYQLGKTDEAIVEFLKINEKFPSSDRANYFLGLLYLEKKQYDRAYPFFNHVPPGSVLFRESLNRQFLILKEKGEFAKAADLVDRRFPSRDLIEYYNLKSTLMMLELDYRGAVSILNQGLNRFKNDERLLFQRALALEKLGQWEKAKKDLVTLITLYPDSAEPYNFLGYTMAERDESLDEALRYVIKASQINPNEGHILDSLAWIYFKKGLTDKSLPLLERAIKLEPEEPTILEHMGHVQFELKNKRKSRDYFNRSLKFLKALERKRPEDLKQIQRIEEKLGTF